MKKTLSILLAAIVCFAACKKSSSSNNNSSPTFTAKLNGTATTFTVSQATLVRSNATNEKRMDIVGTSTDNSKRVILTLGLESSQGSGMTVKSYVLNPFPVDDPSTPDVDESQTTQGYTTYSTAIAGGGWLTNLYDEQGLFTVTTCDSAHTTISGTFETTLIDNTAAPVTTLYITDGVISNLKYAVLN